MMIITLLKFSKRKKNNLHIRYILDSFFNELIKSVNNNHKLSTGIILDDKRKNISSSLDILFNEEEDLREAIKLYP